MMLKGTARQAGVLILLGLVIAAVLEAVARIFNLLNTPINPLFLAAGAISAALIWSRGRV
jgi:hypothetical protein